MKKKKIVIALGHEALGTTLPCLLYTSDAADEL